jgi:flagellar basal-body rod protein FlgB
MFFANLVGRETLPVLEKALAFTEARNRVLAENIANVDTPGYRTKHLDAAAFQEALGQALARRREDPSGALELPSSKEFHEDSSGHLIVTPSEEPPENILFHDGTNGKLERQMAMLAENALMHRAMVELTRDKFDSLMTAIRGRTG